MLTPLQKILLNIAIGTTKRIAQELDTLSGILQNVLDQQPQ